MDQEVVGNLWQRGEIWVDPTLIAPALTRFQQLSRTAIRRLSTLRQTNNKNGPAKLPGRSKNAVFFEHSGALKYTFSAPDRSSLRGDWFDLCEFHKQLLDLALLVRTGEAVDFHTSIIARPAG